MLKKLRIFSYFFAFFCFFCLIYWRIYGIVCIYEKQKHNKQQKGKKYIKVVQENGVFAFIVKEDFKHFKKGDILKAAGYNAPALNQPRGNVLTGNYMIQWTGPLYMDSQRRLR